MVVTALLAKYRVGLQDDIPAMRARQRRRSEQGATAQVEVTIELPTAPAAGGAVRDDGSRPPAHDRRPSFRTLRNRTTSSSEAGGGGHRGAAAGGNAADAALSLLSALKSSSPRRRTSSRDASPLTTSASEEGLLPSRSLSAPSFADLTKQPPPGSTAAQFQIDVVAGPAGRGAMGSGSTAGAATDAGAPAAGGARCSSSSTGPGGLGDHKRALPWILMLLVVGGTRLPYLQKRCAGEQGPRAG